MDIAAWLQEIGLGEYGEIFQANAIDLEILPELTESDLEKLGVLLGHRKRLFKALADAAPPASPVGDFAPRVEDAQRRQLTVMFCDLVGSTPLAARLDPEDLREVISAYHNCVATAVRSFNGFIARFMGDGVLVYFGYPQAHEDEAEMALRAGLAVVDAVPKLTVGGERLQARVGIATGLVVVGDLLRGGDSWERDVVGETPNLAARLQTLAQPDSVLIDAGTRRLVGDFFECRDLGAIEIKGFEDPVQVWQVLRPGTAESRFDALRAGSMTSLIGREEELDLLLRHWQRAKAGQGQIVMVRGEPGIGKSRMVAALQERIAGDRHSRLRFYCSSQYQNSTLYPFITQLTRAAGFARDDTSQTKLDKLEALLGAGSDGLEAIGLFAALMDLPARGGDARPALDAETRRELTLTAFGRQLETLARGRPVLAIFEDAQWSDPTSLDLLERTIARIAELPVLLLITFRLDFAPPWIDRGHAATVTLNRLAPRQSALLIERVAGNKALPQQVLDRIIERADGIPLFVEELAKTLLESEQLREEDGAYVLDRPLLEPAIPASLHASLSARLDRLAPVKEVAQMGAAFGREFSFDALAAVTNWSPASLRQALDQLAAADLIFRRGEAMQDSYIFKHALIRDAAYGSLLRTERQELHGRIAKALVAGFPETAAAQPEIVAHHYTEARVFDSAIPYWREAGARALSRWANVEAAQHLTRGIELLPQLPTGPERDRLEFELYVSLGPAVRGIEGHAAPETQRVFSRARALLDEHGTLKEQMTVLFGQYGVHFVRGEHRAALDIAGQCLELAARHQDARLSPLVPRTGVEMRAFAHEDGVVALGFLGATLWPLGYPEQAAAATQQALQAARDLDHPTTIGFALNCTVFLCGLFESDPEHAAVLADEMVAYCPAEGVPPYAQWARFYQGVAAARRGDPEGGIAIMRDAMAALEQRKTALFRTLQLGHLAAAHARCGQEEVALALLDDALLMAEASEERLFEPELHRLRGQLLLDGGQVEEGEAELMNALAIARGQEARLWELRAAMSLARHWQSDGKTPAACDLLGPLYGWFTEGLDTDELKEAKALLDRLG